VNAEQLIREHATNPLAVAALQPGLERFTHASGLFAYRTLLRRRLVLGDPVCSPATQTALTRAFLVDGIPAEFCAISEAFAGTLAGLDSAFQFACLGVERIAPVLSPAQMSASPLAGAQKEAESAQLTLEEVGPASPTLERLEAINKAFLANRHGEEMTFLNRPLSLRNEPLSRVFALSRKTQGGGSVFGFAVIDPYRDGAGRRAYQLSVLRYERTRLPVLQAVVVRLFERLHAEEASELALGLSPFHRMETPCALRNPRLQMQLQAFERLRPKIGTLDNQRAIKDEIPGRDEPRLVAIPGPVIAPFFVRLSKACGLRLRVSAAARIRSVVSGVSAEQRPHLQGPKAVAALLSLQDGRKALTALSKLAEAHGALVQVNVVKDFYVVASATAADRVLVENPQAYRKGPDFKLIGALAGNGLLTSDGELWLRQRRLVQPAFHRQRLAKFIGIMCEHSDRWVTQLVDGATVNVQPPLAQLALNIVSQSLFSADLSEHTTPLVVAVAQALEIIDQRMSSLMVAPQQIPTPRNLRFQKALKRIDAQVSRVLAERRADGTPRVDLLSMLTEARDEDTGEGMSAQQLRDEVVTLLVAGHETTANGLCWLFQLLAENPAVQQRVRAEVMANDLEPPTPKSLAEQTFTRQVINETLRLYPPVWGFSRTAVKADQLDGRAIKPGSDVFIFPWLLHRSPAYWEQPDVFAPELHFSPAAEKARPRLAFVPFGAGPRQCIGAAFAMMELQIVAGRVLRSFELEPTTRSVEAQVAITLKPRDGVRLKMRRATS
jgi:cytochrome P450